MIPSVSSSLKQGIWIITFTRVPFLSLNCAVTFGRFCIHFKRCNDFPQAVKGDHEYETLYGKPVSLPGMHDHMQQYVYRHDRADDESEPVVLLQTEKNSGRKQRVQDPGKRNADKIAARSPFPLEPEVRVRIIARGKPCKAPEFDETVEIDERETEGRSLSVFEGDPFLP